jgi:putative ABC transport system substrate-binding protein
VFACAEDPVASGLVDSISRPGGNITGASFFASPMEQKRMELLHDLLPAAKRLGVLVNASFLDANKQIKDLQDAARLCGQELLPVSASTDLDFEKAFISLTEQHADVMLVGSDPFLFSRRDQIVAMAARAGIPAVYNDSRYVQAGGLMSYGTIPSDAFQQGGVYVGRFLKGAKTTDLPVVLPDRFELAINLRMAKALGLAVPQSILLRADKVVE